MAQVRQKEEKKKERFEERTAEAMNKAFKKMKDIIWTVGDDIPDEIKERLETAVNKLEGPKIGLEGELFEIDWQNLKFLKTLNICDFIYVSGFSRFCTYLNVSQPAGVFNLID
jgi:hypothetical protein